MADNVDVTPGSGKTFATDDIGGVQYPRVKATWGPDGTANDADVASGKSLPVQVRSATGLIPIGEPTDARSAATDTTSVTLVQVLKEISFCLQAVNTALGTTALDLGVGTSGTRTIRTAIDTSQVPAAGQTTMSASVPVAIASDQSSVKSINGGSQYETVAASQTNQVMGATGAAGDYLSHVIVSPVTAGCGVVTVLDNATAIASFPGGGTTALPSLIPFIIPIGLISTSGAWKITTGANVTAVGVGKFT